MDSEQSKLIIHYIRNRKQVFMKNIIFDTIIGVVWATIISIVTIGQSHLIDNAINLINYNYTEFNNTGIDPDILVKNKSTYASDLKNDIPTNFNLLVQRMEAMNSGMLDINAEEKYTMPLINSSTSLNPNITKFGDCDDLEDEGISDAESPYFSDLSDHDNVVKNVTDTEIIYEYEIEEEIQYYEDEYTYDYDGEEIDSQNNYQDDSENNIKNNHSGSQVLPINPSTTYQKDIVTNKLPMNSFVNNNVTEISNGYKRITDNSTSIGNYSLQANQSSKLIATKGPIMKGEKVSMNTKNNSTNISNFEANPNLQDEEKKFHKKLNDLKLLLRVDRTNTINAIKMLLQERYDNSKRLQEEYREKVRYMAQRDSFMAQIVSIENYPNVIKMGVKMHKNAKCVIFYQNNIMKIIIVANDVNYYKKIEEHRTRIEQFTSKIKKWYVDYETIMKTQDNDIIYESTIENIRYFLQNDLGYSLKKDRSIIEMSCNKFADEKKMVYVVFYYKGGNIKNPKISVKLMAERTEINLDNDY